MRRVCTEKTKMRLSRPEEASKVPSPLYETEYTVSACPSKHWDGGGADDGSGERASEDVLTSLSNPPDAMKLSQGLKVTE
mmetsp:Transcript_23251/g.62871  ORF Transcript_23251/g.62871 Transcript_23251/m.62871 type:complete len:80 (-) Transcript_23251:114-353(-)